MTRTLAPVVVRTTIETQPNAWYFSSLSRTLNFIFTLHFSFIASNLVPSRRGPFPLFENALAVLLVLCPILTNNDKLLPGREHFHEPETLRSVCGT